MERVVVEGHRESTLGHGQAVVATSGEPGGRLVVKAGCELLAQWLVLGLSPELKPAD